MQDTVTLPTILLLFTVLMEFFSTISILFTLLLWYDVLPLQYVTLQLRCVALWYGLMETKGQSDLERLQTVISAAACLTASARKYDHVTTAEGLTLAASSRAYSVQAVCLDIPMSQWVCTTVSVWTSSCQTWIKGKTEVFVNLMSCRAMHVPLGGSVV